MNWSEEIAILIFVKEELAKVDKDGLWPYHFPELAANRARLSHPLTHKSSDDPEGLHKPLITFRFFKSVTL